MATLAAQQYQRDLEALYVNDESFTTPIPAQSSESESFHTGLHHELDVLLAETPVIYNEEENDSTQKKTPEASDIVCTTISTYLASLPGLDTAYMLRCINWCPRPMAISNRARLALQFLSCTCAGDGLSKNHMKGILKFIKGLNGTDAAILPHSIETCWTQIEEVHPPVGSCPNINHHQQNQKNKIKQEGHNNHNNVTFTHCV